jgi:hypothetical protein
MTHSLLFVNSNRSRRRPMGKLLQSMASATVRAMADDEAGLELLLAEPFWISEAEESPPTILRKLRHLDPLPSCYARNQAKCE